MSGDQASAWYASAPTVQSLYRRPLPRSQIPFASPQGRVLFREALEAGTLEGFFPLVEQFHTQSDPAFCGLGSLVMALNALGIDPGRLWRGPWRWFSEELLDCCAPLERVQITGISIEELTCLARCNGAHATFTRAVDTSPLELRETVERAGRLANNSVVIASYSRNELEQTGGGHFSPIGGYHPGRDLALLMDVARFKYPPHWVPLEDLHRAMLGVDPITGRGRGWVVLRLNEAPSSLAYFFSCKEGLGMGDSLERLIGASRAALRGAQPETPEAALRLAAETAVGSNALDCIELRRAPIPEHEQHFTVLRVALSSSAVFGHTSPFMAADRAELSAAWLLAAPPEIWADLAPDLAKAVQAELDVARLPQELAVEVRHVRGQIEFLLQHARERRELQGIDGP